MKNKMQFNVFHMKTMKTEMNEKKNKKKCVVFFIAQQRPKTTVMSKEKHRAKNTKYEMKSKFISIQMMDIYQRLNITQTGETIIQT